MQAGLLICAALAVCIVLPVPVTAREHRSAAVKREFQLTHPCPATGLTSRRCPGYVNDHIVPLACGGPDAVSNMQWQSIREARAKDKWESDSEGVKAGIRAEGPRSQAQGTEPVSVAAPWPRQNPLRAPRRKAS